MVPNNLNRENQVKLSLGACLIPFPIVSRVVRILGMVIPRQQSLSSGILWVLNFTFFESENFKPKKFLGEARDAHGFLGSCSESSIILGKYVFMGEGASGSTKEVS